MQNYKCLSGNVFHTRPYNESLSNVIYIRFISLPRWSRSVVSHSEVTYWVLVTLHTFGKVAGCSERVSIVKLVTSRRLYDEIQTPGEERIMFRDPVSFPAGAIKVIRDLRAKSDLELLNGAYYNGMR